jgi:hypothetical protein
VAVRAAYEVQGAQGEKALGSIPLTAPIFQAAKIIEVYFPLALFRNITRLRVWRGAGAKRQRGGKNTFIWNLEQFS